MWGYSHKNIWLPNDDGPAPEVPKIELNCIGIAEGRYKYLVTYLPEPRSITMKKDYIIDSKFQITKDDLEEIYNKIVCHDDVFKYEINGDMQLYHYDYEIRVKDGEEIYTSRLIDFDVKHDRFGYIINKFNAESYLHDALSNINNELVVYIDRLLMAYDLPSLYNVLNL